MGPVELNLHRICPLGCHRTDAGEAGGVPLRGEAPAEGSRYVRRRQLRAVGKVDAGADVKDVGHALVQNLVPLAEHRPGLKVLVQGKEGLVEQPPDLLLDPLAAGHRIQGLSPVEREAEGREPSLCLLRLRRLLLLIVPRQVLLVGQLLPPAAAAEEEGEDNKEAYIHISLEILLHSITFSQS